MEQSRRLIDAEALKASFEERYDDAFMQMHTRDNKEYWNGVCTGVNWGRNTIADASAVDAVEVVRCRDCRHLYDGADDYCCTLHRGLLRISADSFCSYGERRQQEDG